MLLTLSAAISSSARMPGLRAGVREPRVEARMVPVGEPRHDHVVEVAQQRLERLAVLGRSGGKLRADRARSDLCRDRQVADAREVGLDPRGRAHQIVVEAHEGRRFFSFSICFHVCVFTTSAFVSHARRACPTPNST